MDRRRLSRRSFLVGGAATTVSFAERAGILVFGAHLVWDEGFGNGWKKVDMFSLPRSRARELLFGTAEAAVRHYRGRIAAWSVVNEAVDTSGLRTDVPWYRTI